MGANLCQSKCGVLRIILCFLANQLLSHICSYQSPAIAQGPAFVLGLRLRALRCAPETSTSVRHTGN